jgi:hypothetical protein
MGVIPIETRFVEEDSSFPTSFPSVRSRAGDVLPAPAIADWSAAKPNQSWNHAPEREAAAHYKRTRNCCLPHYTGPTHTGQTGSS